MSKYMKYKHLSDCLAGQLTCGALVEDIERAHVTLVKMK
jgi:hypothetical protein